ncbi:MAG: hypothetical protein K0R78_245 [Pelosinus sp.]|nr:hypothetical protein [Pelosinus sp.]
MQSHAGSKNNVANVRAPIKPLPSQVFDIIEQFLLDVQFGHLILIIQDGFVVKIDKIEKFIISAKSQEKRISSKEKVKKKHSIQVKILSDLQSIQYGQLVIHVNNGQVGQIEKTEKRRFDELEGLYGDGI